MHMTEDRQLLRAYSENGSRGALEALVERHFNLVYSAALRQVRDRHMAEDITQAVFLVMIQKARTIRSGVALGGWLLAVTRSVVVSGMRKQKLDRKHLQHVARPETLTPVVHEWDEISPVIDAELSRLPRKDRDAIVLRFFEDRSFAQIGTELGLSEDAARMRVGRSLERLRIRIQQRNRSITTGRLSTAIGAFAISTAPHHLMAKTITAICESPAPHAISFAKGAIKMLAYTKAKLVGAVAVSLLVSTAGVVVLKSAFSNDGASAPTAADAPLSDASGVSAYSASPQQVAAGIVETAHLENAKAADAAAMINTVFSPNHGAASGTAARTPPLVRADADGRTNTVILSGEANAVGKAMDLLKKLDEPADGPKIQYAQLKYANAADAAAVINAMFAPSNGAAPGPVALAQPLAHADADGRTNTVILSGNGNAVKNGMDLLKKLDEPATLPTSHSSLSPNSR
jgi:RNA polymerase sigma factor (sigma-70 family)